MNPENPSINPPTGPKESDIAVKAAQKRKPVFDPTGRVEGLMAEETKVADVRRHPIGLVLIYLQVIIGLGLAFALILPFLPDAFESLDLSKSSANLFTGVLSLVTLAFGLIFLVLATLIYKGNQLIISDINVTQV